MKWISWYFSGENWTPCRLAHSTQASWAFFSVLQFSAAVGPYVIRFVSSTNPIPWVVPSSKVSSKLLTRKSNRIGERGDPCGIPVATVIGGLWYPLKTLVFFFWSLNPCINCIIHSGNYQYYIYVSLATPASICKCSVREHQNQNNAYSVYITINHAFQTYF